MVGGASLVLRGISPRLTGDVDVIASLTEVGHLVYPEPLAPAVIEAALEVQRTLGLADPRWLNATVATSWARRWPSGLPPDLLLGIEWLTYGTLEVGLVGRAALIPLKIHAVIDLSHVRFDSTFTAVVAVDLSATEQGRKHLGDLILLAPTDEEMARASEWVFDQDTSLHFPTQFDALLDAVRDARG